MASGYSNICGLWLSYVCNVVEPCSNILVRISLVWLRRIVLRCYFTVFMNVRRGPSAHQLQESLLLGRDGKTRDIDHIACRDS